MWKSKMAKAASSHRRKHWNMQRQNAASIGMKVEEATDGWNVTGPNGMCAGPFKTNSEAWHWLDNNTRAKRYGDAA